MRRPLACLLAILGLWVGEVRAAAPPRPPEPLRGAVVSGRVLTCVLKEVVLEQDDETHRWHNVDFWFQPLSGGKPTRVDYLACTTYLPLRWQAAHGALWVTGSSGPPGLGVELEVRYELLELFKGRQIIGPGASPEAAGWGYFAASDAVRDAIYMRQRAEFDTVLHSCFLAASKDRVKAFVLTNVGGRGSAGGGEGLTVVRRYPQRAQERWSFTCLSNSSRWDAKYEEWKHRPETEECTLDVAFREPFQALSRGEDYYFLTASGKLFRAGKPAKGKHRKVVAVWDDKHAPIKAHVSDVDKNRTFLFCDNGPKGKGGPCVFELADGVRLRHYDQKLYKPGDQGPDNLRRVVGYARVLEALR